jgi:hypothetical protein
MPNRPLPMDDYAGPVLPGQRWRNRGIAGHGMDYLSVLRCNGRTVQVMYEGQRTGGSAHKSGHRYGIPMATFRRNYVLVAQAPGVKPEDLEIIAVAEIVLPPPEPPVEHYFRRTREINRMLEEVEGRDVRQAVSALAPTPPAPLAVLAAAEAAVRTLSLEEENPPVQVVEPTADDVPIAEEPEPVPVLEPVLVAVAPVPYSRTTAEADPLDAFLENGRALVRGLDAEVQTLATEHDRLMREATEVEDKLREASRRRDRISAGVDAAIAAALGVPEPEEAPPAAEPVRTVDAGKGGTPRLMGPNGFVPAPGRMSQREWVLGRFAESGSIAIQGIVDEFAAYFQIPREQAIKNISSLLGSQIKRPSPRWPAVVRTGVGTYAVHPARGSV